MCPFILFLCYSLCRLTLKLRSEQLVTCLKLLQQDLLVIICQTLLFYCVTFRIAVKHFSCCLRLLRHLILVIKGVFKPVFLVTIPSRTCWTFSPHLTMGIRAPWYPSFTTTPVIKWTLIHTRWVTLVALIQWSMASMTVSLGHVGSERNTEVIE